MFVMEERKEVERRRVVRVLVVDDSILDRKIVEKLLLKNADGKFEGTSFCTIPPACFCCSVFTCIIHSLYHGITVSWFDLVLVISYCC